ncbi:MAG: hypothetical protein ACRDHZ_07345 [Ktedonobacteraceae bacterium]
MAYAILPPLLRQGVWHTTSPERYASILLEGAILPEPSIPDAERWGTAGGPGLYPYTRYLGGVSLFDFSEFDPDAYEAAYPFSMWRKFVPKIADWSSAIWIRMDPNILGERYIDPAKLLGRWKAEGAFQRKLMPMIEAAHLGAVPSSAFSSVHEYRQSRWRELPLSNVGN